MVENDKEALLEAIRSAAVSHGGTRLTRQQFLSVSGLKLGDLFRHFARWSDALAAAGVNIDPYNQRIPSEDLILDWGQLTRSLGRIPTRNEYKLEGNYSPGVFNRNFGPWSSLPSAFREFAADRPEWVDVVGFLPQQTISVRPTGTPPPLAPRTATVSRSARLAARPTYGDPIDFRGLRHEPSIKTALSFFLGWWHESLVIW